jgi:hypothetical protein
MCPLAKGGIGMLDDRSCFTTISSDTEIEAERKIRVKHRNTGHIYEFQLASIDARLELELESVIEANPTSIVNPVEKQVAARIAARAVVKNRIFDQNREVGV